MVITYFGKQFFKMQFGDIVLAVNPIGKESKSAGARFGADIGLISVNHPDYNGGEQISYGEKKAVVIDGPGEYEIKSIFIKGLPVETEIGGKKYINTIYTLSLDNINICILGALSGKNISAEAKESIEGSDIILVGLGESALPPREAYNLAASFGPKVVIPMDYDSAQLKAFLKEAGDEDAEVMEKYTVKRKDLEGKEGDVVVLKSLF